MVYALEKPAIIADWLLLNRFDSILQKQKNTKQQFSYLDSRLRNIYTYNTGFSIKTNTYIIEIWISDKENKSLILFIDITNFQISKSFIFKNKTLWKDNFLFLNTLLKEMQKPQKCSVCKKEFHIIKLIDLEELYWQCPNPNHSYRIIRFGEKIK